MDSKRRMWFPGPGLLALALCAALSQHCICPGNPSDIPVNPDCPNGRRAPAALVIQADLSGIRPLGAPKQIQLRGTRTGDSCFAEGAAPSFVTTLNGTGTATATPPIPGQLADGSWTFKVVALSGGDQPPLQQDHVLAAGSTTTLGLSGDSSGTMKLSFP